MNKLILASVAVLGLAGAAAAQEAPALIYSDAFAANVLNADGASGYTGTASIAPQGDYGVPGDASFNVNGNQNYSGR